MSEERGCPAIVPPSKYPIHWITWVGAAGNRLVICICKLTHLDSEREAAEVLYALVPCRLEATAMLCWPQEGKVEGRSMLRQRVGTSIRAVVFLRSLNLTTVLPTLCPRLVMGGVLACV